MPIHIGISDKNRDHHEVVHVNVHVNVHENVHVNARGHVHAYDDSVHVVQCVYKQMKPFEFVGNLCYNCTYFLLYNVNFCLNKDTIIFDPFIETFFTNLDNIYILYKYTEKIIFYIYIYLICL